MGSELGFLDCFLHDPMCGSDLILDEDSELGESSSRVQNSGRFISDFDSENFGSDVNNKMDLLSTSLHENGLLMNQNSQQQNEVKNTFRIISIHSRSQCLQENNQTRL